MIPADCTRFPVGRCAACGLLYQAAGPVCPVCRPDPAPGETLTEITALQRWGSHLPRGVPASEVTATQAADAIRAGAAAAQFTGIIAGQQLVAAGRAALFFTDGVLAGRAFQRHPGPCRDCGQPLTFGTGEEAGLWRTEPGGRYVCRAAADALHHPANYPRR
jgi:hypothetical protein